MKSERVVGYDKEGSTLRKKKKNKKTRNTTVKHTHTTITHAHAPIDARHKAEPHVIVALVICIDSSAKAGCRTQVVPLLRETHRP